MLVHFRTLTARAATRAGVATEIADSTSINSFARPVIGIVLIAENAVELVKERRRFAHTGDRRALAG